MNTPFDIVTARISGFQPVTSTRDDIARAGRAFCPVCGDGHKRKLDIAESSSGVLLIKCRRDECCTDDIMQSLGLNAADLFPHVDRLAPQKLAGIQLWQSAASAAEVVADAGFRLSMSSPHELHERQIELEQAVVKFQAAVRAAFRGERKRGAK